ncbi:MAG: Iojap-related protein [Candidatus Angelobacter sp.]|nr:Iojap-related protein [Candidatus Angelobacter sp.]MCU1331037.1 Iojap-related protein [Candidatus Angelobacter sp.]
MSLQTRQQVTQAVRAIEGKKGEDIVILEMDKNSGAFTDYFVVCSGTNPRQIQAIADDVQKQMAEVGQRPNSVEGYTQAEWVLLDYVDFVLHVFSERARKFYDLERLWKSARKLSPSDLAKKPAAKKQAAAKKEAKPPGRKKSAAPRKAARTKPRTQSSRTKKKTRKSA